MIELSLQRPKGHPTTRAAFYSAGTYPINKIKKRFEFLDVKLKSVEVHKYPTDKEVRVLNNALM